MPGTPVYQDSPSNLKSQFYATTGSSVVNVLADTSGRLKVTTDAAAPLDVSISQANDSILVYGNDGANNQMLKTDTNGVLQVNDSVTFTDTTLVTAGATTDVYQYTTEVDISLSNSYSFFINNSGVASVDLIVELSPNNTDWVEDGTVTTVATTQMTILSANKFLKYIRVGYKSTTAGNASAVTIIYQGQS